MLRKLRGMFALAVWDAASRGLTLARGPDGIKALCVSHHAAGPVFALRRYLESVARGELDFEPRLRTHDQTTPLAQSRAHALETLNGRLVAIRATAGEVRVVSGDLSAKIETCAGSEESRRKLAALLARGEELHREIEFFHLRGSGKG